MRGLLVAAEREMVARNVKAVQAAGLVVTSVDLIPFALLRSIGTALDVDTDTEALVDIGARMTNIIVHSAGVPRFVRVLPTGGQDITDALVERLQVPFAEAEQLKIRLGVAELSTADPAAQALASSALPFIDEIRSSLDYYAASHPRYPAERIVLTGGGARLSGLADRMNVMTRLPVVADDPMARLTRGRGVHAEDGDSLSSWAAVPVGLAMGAAS
jgi:type IV pilus assembly protein PilM